MLKTLLFIGMGSFTGGVLRYLISRYVQNFLTPSFPLGTLLVNILGCFAIGLFYGLFERGNLMNPNLKMFLTVGFCGGFTTFSTFMNENFQLIKDDNFFSSFAEYEICDGFLFFEQFLQGACTDFLFLHHGRSHTDGLGCISFDHMM